MAVFGIVMLLKPVVPLWPITVIAKVVELAAWLVVRVTLDIWALVTFPLIARLTVAPLSVLAFTVVSNGVGEGDGFAVGVGVDVRIGVGGGSDVLEGGAVGLVVGVGAGVGEIDTANELLTPE
jgi:hypothetical protein